jgi:hypothetical protein
MVRSYLDAQADNRGGVNDTAQPWQGEVLKGRTLPPCHSVTIYASEKRCWKAHGGQQKATERLRTGDQG